jgi:D-isomer specific 2-hydroxyacid dehydrogenase, NAD binding domain
MSGANSFKFVLLPPQTDTTRDWAKRLAEIVPEAHVIVAEDADTAAREIVHAEVAFGWLGSDLLLKARKLRWLQAPQAAPPAGYYYPELIAHSVVVTNFREIFNDHIGAQPTAFFINIGRGMTTKLDDLVTVLEAGEIGGAALDVYEQEPLPRDHRLWTLPNVLLTPHMAGHGPYLNDRRSAFAVTRCRVAASASGS